MGMERTMSSKGPVFSAEASGREICGSPPDKAMTVWGSCWLRSAGLGKGTGRACGTKGVVTSPSSCSALNKLEGRRGQVFALPRVEEVDFPDGAAGR